MKFEPGEKYFSQDVGCEVIYIGVYPDGRAVVDCKHRGLTTVRFCTMAPVKKKQRFWIELPQEPRISEFTYSALAHSNLNYLKEYCHALAEAKHDRRYIQVETVEPVDPL